MYIYINKKQNKKLFHLYNFMGEHIFNMHAFKKKKLYTVRREQMPKKDIQLASVLHAMSLVSVYAHLSFPQKKTP